MKRYCHGGQTVVLSGWHLVVATPRLMWRAYRSGSSLRWIVGFLRFRTFWTETNQL